MWTTSHGRCQVCADLQTRSAVSVTFDFCLTTTCLLLWKQSRSVSVLEENLWWLIATAGFIMDQSPFTSANWHHHSPDVALTGRWTICVFITTSKGVDTPRADMYAAVRLVPTAQYTRPLHYTWCVVGEAAGMCELMSRPMFHLPAISKRFCEMCIIFLRFLTFGDLLTLAHWLLLKCSHQFWLFDAFSVFEFWTRMGQMNEQDWSAVR